MKFRYFSFIAAASALAMVSCTDDKDPNSPVNPDPEENAEGITVKVTTNPATLSSLVTNYPNSQNRAYGRSAADGIYFDATDMPGIPSAEELAAMNQVKNDFNSGWWRENDQKYYNGEPIFHIGDGVTTQSGISSTISVVNPETWQTEPISNLTYYISGKVTTSIANGEGLTLHILPGAELTLTTQIQAGTTVYIHGAKDGKAGGKILRAGDENQVMFNGATVRSTADVDLPYVNYVVESGSDFRTTGSINAKEVTLNRGTVFAGCAVTATEKLYMTGSNSTLSLGYVSAPTIEMAGGEGEESLNIVLRDGGYIESTNLNLRNIGNLLVEADDDGVALIKTGTLDVNSIHLKGTFYRLYINYDEITGSQETTKDEETGEYVIKHIWNETVFVNDKKDDIKITHTQDKCAPVVIEKNPAKPDDTNTPPIEDIGQISHGHDISATCIFTGNNNGYASWHTQGPNFHGCIEHWTIENGEIELQAYLETDESNTEYGAIDFNHVIFDNGKIFVAGDHPKKGGIVGWINCNGGTFPTDNEAVLNMKQLFSSSKKGPSGSGNCIIRNGNYYQIASIRGFETFEVNAFNSVNAPKPIANLASYTFLPGATEENWDNTQTGKHIATDGNKVAMLTLVNRDNANNVANASIRVFDANDIEYKNGSEPYVIEDELLTPVNGKNVIAIEGNDIWVCLGNGGVKHLAINGNTISEVASFKLADMDKETLKSFNKDLTPNRAAKACANGLAVDENYVYVSHGGAGLVLLDREDLSMVGCTRYNGGKSANYVSLGNNDGYIYVAYGLSKIQVYKLADF